MRCPCVALLVLLTLAAQSAPAQQQPPVWCDPPRVTLRENETVPAPAALIQNGEPVLVSDLVEVFFYDYGSEKEVKFALQGQSGGAEAKTRSFTPDKQAIAKAASLKESGRIIRLAWANEEDAQPIARTRRRARAFQCLQEFDVVTEMPVLVQLDATGIESRFLNPVGPIPIGDRPLQFFNNTGDRTFVVSIPFAYSTTELTSAYAVADYNRGRQVVSKIVCDVLDRNADEANRCDMTGETKDEDTVSMLEGLRVQLEAVSNAKPASLKDECERKGDDGKEEPHLKSGGCIAESLFWAATCDMETDVIEFARTRANEEIIRDRIRRVAPEFVRRFYEEGDLFPLKSSPQCTFEKAKGVQARVVGALEVDSLIAKDKSSEEGVAEQFSYAVKSAGLKSRFETARIDITKASLKKAIRDETGYPEVSSQKRNLPQMLGWRKGPREVSSEIGNVFNKLESTRKALMRAERIVKGETEKAILQCQLREVEAAGKLLASYSPDAYVPYDGIPDTVIVAAEKARIKDRETKLAEEEANLEKGKTKLAAEGKLAEEEAKLAARKAELAEEKARLAKEKGELAAVEAGKECTVQAEEMMQDVLAARMNEQGIEITDCTSDSSSATCSATATIRPYQRATFSRAVLAHHSQPRIRFAVAFFGETEIPANANGYVTRADAAEKDEKPKSEFAVQLGGDASTSREPDEALAIGVRRSGATGTLGFQYTGPVEASATVQYKSGDFGGASSSTQLDAVQYQAKVFGPKLLDRWATTLQYGRLQFAKPSSGIAVSVFGEGGQLTVGRASLGYIVLRESDNPEMIADTQNDDSDLWILQIKSFPISQRYQRFLRTLELVGLLGEDRKDGPKGPTDGDDETVADPRPFTYSSVGGEVRWGWPDFAGLGGSFAFYQSEIDVDTLPGHPAVRRDGRGRVGLARVSWNRLSYPDLARQQRFLPEYGLSALVGRGTGDSKDSSGRDEGYLGENAGFANDMLFLSRVSKAFPNDIGIGLANKWYGGLQYTEERWSLLSVLARIIGVKESDLKSQSTLVSAHGYELVNEVHGRHWGGKELDVSFTLEAPKDIRWSLGAAHYWKSTAVQEAGVTENLWSVMAKLAITLSGQ